MSLDDKTRERAETLRRALWDQLLTLPDADAWGESNASEKRRMRLWHNDLAEVLDEGHQPTTAAVRSFLEGTDDEMLKDFIS